MWDCLQCFLPGVECVRELKSQEQANGRPSIRESERAATLNVVLRLPTGCLRLESDTIIRPNSNILVLMFYFKCSSSNVLTLMF